jgi:hypothetical protein
LEVTDTGFAKRTAYRDLDAALTKMRWESNVVYIKRNTDDNYRHLLEKISAAGPRAIFLMMNLLRLERELFGL